MNEGGCPSCGGELVFNEKEQKGLEQIKCPKCKHKFGINEAKPIGADPQKKQRNNIIAAIAVVVVLLLCCSSGSLFSSDDDSPETTVNTGTVTQEEERKVVEKPEEPIANEYSPDYPVIQIVDGDTIKIDIEGTTETIRLIGIDSPENGDCYYSEATQELSRLISGKNIQIEKDPSQGERDKYDRLLAYVWFNQLNVNKQMIRRGYAEEYTYDKPYKYQEEFQTEYETAANSNKGMFGDACACIQGEEETRSCTSCNVATVLYNNWDCTTFEESVTDYSCTSGCAAAPAPTPPPTTSSYTCNCSKTCVQMTSCAEAQYQLNTCGCTQRDGDNDGVACDTDCQ